MFGKVMSIPDSAMRNFFDLVTRFSTEEIDRKFSQFEAGELHLRDLKMQLASRSSTSSRAMRPRKPPRSTSAPCSSSASCRPTCLSCGWSSR